MEIPYKNYTQFVVRAVEHFDRAEAETLKSVGFAPVLVKTVGKATERILDMNDKNEKQFHPYIYNTMNPTSICYVTPEGLSHTSRMYRTLEIALAAIR